MSESSVHLLGQASGYGILVGVGGLFAIMIIVSTKLAHDYLNENAQSTETFMVARRRVGVGLTGLAIFSSWFWSTELLLVCTMVYNYGIMASFYYGAGLCVQICLMSVLGAEAKKKIPKCHTSLEIVNLRYGKTVHLLFMFLCLVNNLLSSASMIIAAAGAISIIAGNLHPVASAMLIPFGVLLYTTVGGLKATFITDFVHSFIALVILCYINTALISSEAIGGLDGLYTKILEHDSDRYIEGNYEGSFITGKSKGAIIFGIILTIGNFGLTVMDSSYWQKSFSADVRAQVPGYLIAATTIFSIVWPLGAIAGLASIILENSPSFPTYPRSMNQFEIDSGFVLPYVLKGVLGDRALGGLLLAIYLAVTSTVSAQLVSVSSIVSFDIYKTYINKSAHNQQMIRVSHFGVIFFGLFAAAFSVMLHYVGVNMTWMSYFYSMIIGPGVIPLVFTITWKRQTKIAAFLSPVIGIIFGLTVWLSTANHYFGEVNVTTLGKQLPCLFGGLTAILLPGVTSIILSLTIKPYTFDWQVLKQAQILIEPDDDNETDSKVPIDIKSKVDDYSFRDIIEVNSASEQESNKYDPHEKILSRYRKVAIFSFVFVLLLTWVVWPLPLYRDWIWNEAYFKGYITVGLIWIYLTFLVIGVFPLYDGRYSLKMVAKGVYKDYIKKR